MPELREVSRLRVSVRIADTELDEVAISPRRPRAADEGGAKLEDEVEEDEPPELHDASLIDLSRFDLHDERVSPQARRRSDDKRGNRAEARKEIVMNEKLIIVGMVFVAGYFLTAFCVVGYRIVRKLLGRGYKGANDRRAAPRRTGRDAEARITLVVIAFAFCLPITGVARADVSMVGFSDRTFLGTAGPFEMADSCRETYGNEDLHLEYKHRHRSRHRENFLRVCTVDEVFRTANPPMLDVGTKGWVNPMGSNFSTNACKGWKKLSNASGTAVSGAGLFFSLACTEERPAACCAERRSN